MDLILIQVPEEQQSLNLILTDNLQFALLFMTSVREFQHTFPGILKF